MRCQESNPEPAGFKLTMLTQRPPPTVIFPFFRLVFRRVVVVAQLVEHYISNPNDPGSNPARSKGSSITKKLDCQPRGKQKMLKIKLLNLR